MTERHPAALSTARCSIDLSKEVALACLQREISILRRAGREELADALLAPLADVAAAYDNVLEKLAANDEQQAPGEHP